MSPETLAHWFEDHRTHLTDVARHIVGTRADADDIVQDAFLKALTGLGDAIRSPAAWMTTTVRHLAFDRLRHRRVIEQFVASDGDRPDVAPSAEDVTSDRLAAAALVRRIVEAIDEHDALALLLHIVFDEDHATIARRFGRSEGAMRVALHRARRRVRDAKTHRTTGRDAARDRRAAQTFAVGWHAIESGDAGMLHALIDERASTMSHEDSAIGTTGSPPVRIAMVRQSDRYVLALRQGGRLICVLPIGVVTRDEDCAID